MLDIMRRKKRLKVILWLVIFSLALGMLLFFIPGINVGNVVTDTSAATVDGQVIPMKEFAKAYRRFVDRYTNNGQNSVDPEMLRSLGVSKQVLDNLISFKVMESIAKRMGIKVTPEEVRRTIEAFPYFQDQGKFIGIERYKATLAANKYTVADFEDDVYRSELVKKLRGVITDSLDVSDRELREEFSKENQKTTIDFVLLKKDDYKKRIKPAEAELRAYFDGHKEMYRIKEKRRIQYLLIPVDQIRPSIKVTEEEINDEWGRNSHEEMAEAAHILFRVPDPSKEAEVKAKAETVLKRAKAGEDFAALAKKYSEDTGSAGEGGFLGKFPRGQMVKEFSDVAFSLKLGEISGLVHTQFGYHIIKGMGLQIPTLESNRPSLITAIQLRKAQDAAKQKADEAATLAEKQKDLNLIGAKLGIPTEVKETNPFGMDNDPFEIGISQAMRDEAFKLKELNSVGKAMEHPLGFAIPKLVEVQMPKPGDFNISRPQVEKDYIESKAKELAQADAKKLSEDAGKLGSLEKAAKAMGLSIKTSKEFNASEPPDPEIGSSAAFNQAVSELNPGSISAPHPLLENSIVFQIKSRSPFDESAFQKAKPDLRKKLLQSIQEPYFQDYVRRITDQLEKAGKVRINPRALEQS
jgi:peptidyl-prolyl cis-trans isomerase D